MKKITAYFKANLAGALGLILSLMALVIIKANFSSSSASASYSYYIMFHGTKHWGMWEVWALGLILSCVGLDQKPRGTALAGLMLSLSIVLFTVANIIAG